MSAASRVSACHSLFSASSPRRTAAWPVYREVPCSLVSAREGSGWCPCWVQMSAHSWRVHTQDPPCERFLVAAYFSSLLGRKGTNECPGNHSFEFGASKHKLGCSCVRFLAQKVSLFASFRHTIQVVPVYLHLRFASSYKDDQQSFVEKSSARSFQVESVSAEPNLVCVDWCKACRCLLVASASLLCKRETETYLPQFCLDDSCTSPQKDGWGSRSPLK